MTSSPHPLSSVEEAASAWFLRRREQPGADEAAFQAWLAQSPLHGQEYDKLAGVWDELAALPRPAMPARARLAAPRRSWGWRWGGAFAAALVVLGAAYQFVPVSHTSIANATGQTRQLELPDGTRLHANAGTRLSVRYTLAERYIRIDAGEVFIDAAADRRPLVVAAGEAQLRDIGTEFNVLLLPELLQVGVRSGQVQLDAAGVPAQSLSAGETLVLARLPGSTPQRLSVAAAEIGAWQDGLVVMHGASLQQLADYLRLYRAAPVRVVDARARSLKVSGTLDVKHPDALLDMLPGLLPVMLVRGADGSVLISSR